MFEIELESYDVLQQFYSHSWVHFEISFNTAISMQCSSPFCIIIYLQDSLLCPVVLTFWGKFQAISEPGLIKFKYQVSTWNVDYTTVTMQGV